MVRCQMDRGPSLFPLCALIYCVFQTARFSIGDESVCPCPKIPLVNLTETPQTDCFHVGARFRYACKAGYVREAGTSNLIRCVQRDERAEWTKPNLACKRDPRRSPTEPTHPPLIRDHAEFLNASIIPTTVTETTSVDTARTGVTASAPFLAGTTSSAIGAPDAPPPPLIAENRTADFASEPKYIASFCVALVGAVALVGGIIYIFCKRRSSTVEQPLPAEQIPLRK